MVAGLRKVAVGVEEIVARGFGGVEKRLVHDDADGVYAEISTPVSQHPVR